MANGDERSRLLGCYEVLESASAEMLQAARRGDWDSVCRLEAACCVMIARLRALAETDALRPGEQPERMRILRSILANDAQLRRICEPLPAFLESGSGAPAGTVLH
jgi:flagellar protein FliT